MIKRRHSFIKKIAALLLVVVLFAVTLPAPAKALSTEGLFAGRFRAGTQLFDVQRTPVSEGYNVSRFTRPFCSNSTFSGQFDASDLVGKYFCFTDLQTTTRVVTYNSQTSSYEQKVLPMVALYMYNESDGSAAVIEGKISAADNGFVSKGHVEFIADEGFLYIDKTNSWGYFIANKAGYAYNDFMSSPLALRNNPKHSPSMQDLVDYEASDVLMDAGQILIRFIANSGSVANMPNPAYILKTADVDYSLNDVGTPTQTGYDFVGWNTRADGRGVTYAPGAVYTSNTGADLYAMWTAVSTTNLSQTEPQAVGILNAAYYGSTGELVNTTTDMQYRTAEDAKTWYWCTDNKTTVWPGEYWIRYAPKDGYDASPEARIGTVLQPYPTPNRNDFIVTNLTATNSNDGYITQVKQGTVYEYSYPPYLSWNEITGNAITSMSAGNVQIRAKAIPGIYMPSESLLYAVKQPAPSAPDPSSFTITNVSTYGGTDGSIAGTDNTMEYWDGVLGSRWVSISTNSISNLPAGDYNIRYKQTGTNLESDYITLTVTQPAQTPSIRFTSPPQAIEVVHGRIRETLSATAVEQLGGTVTLTWYAASDSSRTNPLATGGTLTIPTNLVPGSYTYVCEATADGAAAVSASATVTVNSDTYTVTYNDNGATTAHSGGSTTFNTSTRIFTLPTAPQKTGHLFVGWKVTSASQGGTGFALNNVITGSTHTLSGAYGNVTLTAQWTAETYPVNYNANGGSGNMIAGTATYGTAFTLPNCTLTAPNGMRFRAWAIGSANGTQALPGNTQMLSAPTTLYALWELSVNTTPSSFVTNHAPETLTITIGRGIPGINVSDFSYLTVNGGERIDASSPNIVSIETGSIVITLAKSYLDTLPVGNYDVNVTLVGTYAGEYTAEITVNAPRLPATGDSGLLFVWVAFMLLAAVGLWLSTALKKTNKITK